MGWFDAKSWKLRRKIKDLQADLKAAEAEGKYVVEDGLFFAELEDMGEMTMMVFGTTDILAAQEESVIRGFFDRNGFAVERAKINREHTGLEDVEIIPPEEFTRVIGRAVKTQGFRMVDDSEKEMSADLEKRIFPLSALLRAISTLFAARAQAVVTETDIKKNKEGNRLLHWLPKIQESLAQKVDDRLVDVVRPHFEAAYDQFYRRIMNPTAGEPMTMHMPAAAPPVPEPVRQKPDETARLRSPSAGAPRPLPAKAPEPARSPAGAPRPAGGAPADAADSLDLEFAEAMGRIYKSLVRTTTARCVRNSQVILDEINRAFKASATCVLTKVPHGHGLAIHAQAGKQLAWGEGKGGEGYAVSSSILSACVKERQVVTVSTGGPQGDGSESMIAYSIDATAAAPIVVQGEICGILYLDRRGGRMPFSDKEKTLLARAATVFEEFPDLTIGLT